MFFLHSESFDLSCSLVPVDTKKKSHLQLEIRLTLISDADRTQNTSRSESIPDNTVLSSTVREAVDAVAPTVSIPTMVRIVDGHCEDFDFDAADDVPKSFANILRPLDNKLEQFFANDHIWSVVDVISEVCHPYLAQFLT